MSDALSALRELRGLILRLSVISHAPIQGYNFAPGEVGRGERWRTSAARPPIPHLGSHHNAAADTALPRGTDKDRPGRKATGEEVGDWMASYQRRDVAYFVGELENAETPERIFKLRDEARWVVGCWKRTPIPKGQEPEFGSAQWKRYIGASTESVGGLARRFGCSRQYIIKIQHGYGTLASREARIARDRRVANA